MEVIRTELKKVSVGWPSFGILSQFQLYIHLYSVSGTESLLQSNALKKLLVKILLSMMILTLSGR